MFHWNRYICLYLSVCFKFSNFCIYLFIFIHMITCCTAIRHSAISNCVVPCNKLRYKYLEFPVPIVDDLSSIKVRLFQPYCTVSFLKRSMLSCHTLLWSFLKRSMFSYRTVLWSFLNVRCFPAILYCEVFLNGRCFPAVLYCEVFLKVCVFLLYCTVKFSYSVDVFLPYYTVKFS